MEYVYHLFEKGVNVKETTFDEEGNEVYVWLNQSSGCTRDEAGNVIECITPNLVDDFMPWDNHYIDGNGKITDKDTDKKSY